MKSISHRIQGILLMLIASFFFASMSAFVKTVSNSLPVMEAVFVRGLMISLVVSPWMIYQKVTFVGKNWKLLLLRSVLGFIGLSLSFYLTTVVPLGTAAIFNRSSVLFLAVLSVFFLKEKMTWGLGLYTFLAFIGIGMIVKPSFHEVDINGLVGIAVGVSAALAYICLKKLHQTEAFLTIVFHFGCLSALGSLLLFGKEFLVPTINDLLVLLGVGLCGTLGQLCMTYSYKHIEASVVSPYSFAAVLFSAFYGLVFWNEIPDIWSMIGGLLVIVCGVGIMKMKQTPQSSVV